MPDYSKGKIYKIVADTDEEYKPYVGSTIQTLSNRMAGHRKDKKNSFSSCKLFERFGVDKCKIILIEEYPCDTYEQLLSRERYWFDNIECCNKIRPFITKEERIEYEKNYNEQHKEEIIVKRKERYEKFKEEIIEESRKYREQHKEEIAVKRKEKYEKNKEKYAEKYKCSCGSIYRKISKSDHEKTKKHISFISK